ncbi:MAG: hypothetical protein KJ600_04765 [Nanoarchaeota archaeon]|nr:hypothetical protein [Nanoarchaeota archaeon]MBU1103841.1 hypothetical protein [Nanoarchaeota archaeon]
MEKTKFAGILIVIGFIVVALAGYSSSLVISSPAVPFGDDIVMSSEQELEGFPAACKGSCTFDAETATNNVCCEENSRGIGKQASCQCDGTTCEWSDPMNCVDVGCAGGPQGQPGSYCLAKKECPDYA